ncbi:Atrial natriuretic peptide receptor 1 [Hypsibius exemplaris]|uniref:guanylate cyclase n=1 Tax=Hypsibius exemplaris TaxID=2072580 RepID=A0A1W0WRS0_HYPEX|nr:Atrial natriuretic peptide receptor 1 [Hypsibius exemplaris]
MFVRGDKVVLLLLSLCRSAAEAFVTAANNVTSVEIICFTVISPVSLETSFPWPALAYDSAIRLANSGRSDLNITIKYVTDPSIQTCDDMKAVATYNVSNEYYTRQFVPNMTVLIYTDEVGGVDDKLQAAGHTPTWVTTSLLDRNGMQAFLLKIFQSFHWRAVSFVLDVAADPWFKETRDVLYNAVRNKLAMAQPYQMEFSSLTGKDHKGKPIHPSVEEQRGNFSSLLLEIKKSSRIVVYLGGTRELRILMAAAESMNMTDGDYVYICAEPYPHPSWGNFSWQWFDELDKELEKAWRSVMVLTMSSKELHRQELLRQYFPDWRRAAEKLYYFPLPDSADINFSQVMSFEGVLIFVEILHESIHEDPPPDLSDGAAFTRRFYNRSVDIFTGSVHFNDKGVRLVDMVLKDYDPQSQKLEPCLYFDSGDSLVTWVRDIDWPYRSSAPLNEPPCGFAGRGTIDCLHAHNSAITTAWASVLALLIVLIISGFVIRRSHLLQQLSIIRPWLLLSSEILQPPSPKTGRSLSATEYAASSASNIPSGTWSHHRTATSSSHNYGLTDTEAIPNGHRTFRGREIWVTAVSTAGKGPLQTRRFIQLCNILHAINKDNINKFVGISFDVEDAHLLLLVDSYCHKGSLREVLTDGHMNREFQKSFVQDIVRGLQYIHGSFFKYHGELTSLNCLISRHFVLKIAKLGYRELKALIPPPRVASRRFSITPTITSARPSIADSAVSMTLWTAPELLLQTDPQPNQKADIFAFGAILFEIFMGSGLVFDAVFQPSRHPTGILRFPSKVVPDDISNFIEECCDADPFKRPTIEVVHAHLYALLQIKSRENVMTRIQQRLEMYARDLETKVAERTRDLLAERKLCDSLLEEMLPRVIVERLRSDGDVDPKMFDMVTIYFSDIDGFGELALDGTPYDVIVFLNNVYSMFDTILMGFDVYKVETINDSYVVVSGLPVPNGDNHASAIAAMSLALMKAYSHAFFRGATKLRIGMHSGPIAAGVVGRKTPRYCLFGDTMNTASRMESHGLPDRIHVSPFTATFLLNNPAFHLTHRGVIMVKGKGDLETYWLETAERKR